MEQNEIVIGLNTCIHRMHEGGYCETCTKRMDAAKAGRCVNCFVRPATNTWVGDGGVVGYVHGFHERWCLLCVSRAQLEHCEKAAARIEGLRASIAQLEAVPDPPPPGGQP